MRAIDALRDLFWPIDAAGQTTTALGTPRPAAPPPDEGKRALVMVGAAMAAGLAAIVLLALSQAGLHAAVRTLATAIFAALAAAAGGAMIGLLFGMPASVGRVVVAAPAAEGATAPSATTTTPAADWYRDNAALERLSDWLTTAIVALTIANFDTLIGMGNSVALAVTAGLGLPGTAQGGNGVAGGLILSSYGLLGFLGGYLWSRFHLRNILTDRAAAAIDRQRQSEADAKKVSAAEQDNAVQGPKGDDAVEQAQTAATLAKADDDAELQRLGHLADVAARTPPARTADPGDTLETIQPAVPAPAPLRLPEVLFPGTVADDPWKGKFGGLPQRSGRRFTATVSPLETYPDRFAIKLKLLAFDQRQRVALRGAPVRVYLHPSFPKPIREQVLDGSGELSMSLIAYGAFTIGVQFHDGVTLELDLAKLPDAPAAFRLN